MTAVAAQGLCVSREHRPVIKGVSFEAHPGDLIGVIGPNGSGKSTLLASLAGLVPYSGSISLGDRNLSGLSLSERALTMAYVPQDRHVAWALKVEDVVALGRGPHRSRFLGYDPSGKAAIEAAIEALDLQALRQRPISVISGGERARADCPHLPRRPKSCWPMNPVPGWIPRTRSA